MCKVKSYLSEEGLLSLYNTMIESYFNYCSEVQGLTGKKYCIQNYYLSKMSMRMVCKVSRNSHTKIYLKNLKFLNSKIKVITKFFN